MEGEEETSSQKELTTDQKQRIQRNKERARALKEQRRRSHPYEGDGGREKGPSNSTSTATPHAESRDQQQPPQHYRNSHAGFMFETEEESSVNRHEYHLVEDEGV